MPCDWEGNRTSGVALVHPPAAQGPSEMSTPPTVLMGLAHAHVTFVFTLPRGANAQSIANTAPVFSLVISAARYGLRRYKCANIKLPKFPNQRARTVRRPIPTIAVV